MSNDRVFHPSDPDFPSSEVLRAHLHQQGRIAGAKAPPSAVQPNIAREFSQAERALIRSVHGFMAAEKLLDLLNDRLAADRGGNAPRFSMAQLHAEIATITGAKPSDGALDWAGLRKALASARSSGVLHQIDEQRIADFSIVFGLNAKQQLTLKEIVLGARGDVP